MLKSNSSHRIQDNNKLRRPNDHSTIASTTTATASKVAVEQHTAAMNENVVEEEEEVDIYVQESLHECVQYARKGCSNVPEELLNAIKFILEVYNVPSANKV